MIEAPVLRVELEPRQHHRGIHDGDDEVDEHQPLDIAKTSDAAREHDAHQDGLDEAVRYKVEGDALVERRGDGQGGPQQQEEQTRRRARAEQPHAPPPRLLDHV